MLVTNYGASEARGNLLTPSAPLSHLIFKFLGEGGGDSRVSKAPTNDTAIGVVPTMTALRFATAPRMKIMHGTQLRAETSERHGDVNEVGVIALDSFRVLSAFVAARILILAKRKGRHARKRSRAFFPSLAASVMLSKKTGERSTGTALHGL